MANKTTQDLIEEIADNVAADRASRMKTPVAIPVTTTVGEITSSSFEGGEIPAGTDIFDLLTRMLSKDKNPSITSNPSVNSFSVTNNGSGTEFEAGTSITPKWSAGFNPGSYTYKSTKSKTDIDPVDGTGVTVSAWEILQGSTKIGSAVAGTGTAFTLGDSTIAFTAKATHTNGNYALTQLNKLPKAEVRIAEGTKGKTATITTYRALFYGALYNNEALTSEKIRGLTNGGNYNSKKTITIKADGESGIKRFVVAIPSNSTRSGLTEALSTAGMTVNVTASYTKQTKAVKVEGVNGYTAIDYDVYVFAPAAIDADTVHEITLG